MAPVNVVNTRTTPYIVDEEGHLLAGGERGQVDDTNPRVQRALDAGVFLRTDPPSGSAVSTPPPADPAEAA